MARQFLLILTLLSLTGTFAQYSAGGCHSGKPMDRDELALISGTTTIFFLRTTDEARADEWKKAVETAWTFTPIEVHPVTDMPAFADKMASPQGYSFITLESSWTMMDNYVPSVTLLFWVPTREAHIVNGQESEQRQQFMRMNMEVDLAVLDYALSHNYRSSFASYLYSDAPLPFWLPHIMADMLRRASADLKDGVCYNATGETRVSKENKAFVAANPLYVCEGSLRQWTYKDKRLQYKNEQAEMLDALDHPTKVISEAELDRMLADPDQPPFLFLLSTHREYLAHLTLWKSGARGAVQWVSTEGHRLNKGFDRILH
jgi:hypothetical protein